MFFSLLQGTKERLDRQILTPWVKYLWECYRTILDVLRNNAKLEQLYHATARAAFDFCKRFQRNMEFRRLCEILRSHLFSVTRFQNQTNAVDLNSAETQTLYLETRFQQLRMAADLELWQEAYRTIEDIHEVSESKRTTTTKKNSDDVYLFSSFFLFFLCFDFFLSFSCFLLSF